MRSPPTRGRQRAQRAVDELAHLRVAGRAPGTQCVAAATPSRARHVFVVAAAAARRRRRLRLLEILATTSGASLRGGSAARHRAGAGRVGVRRRPPAHAHSSACERRRRPCPAAGCSERRPWPPRPAPRCRPASSLPRRRSWYAVSVNAPDRDQLGPDREPTAARAPADGVRPAGFAARAAAGTVSGAATARRRARPRAAPLGLDLRSLRHRLRTSSCRVAPVGRNLEAHRVILVVGPQLVAVEHRVAQVGALRRRCTYAERAVRSRASAVISHAVLGVVGLDREHRDVAAVSLLAASSSASSCDQGVPSSRTVFSAFCASARPPTAARGTRSRAAVKRGVAQLEPGDAARPVHAAAPARRPGTARRPPPRAMPIGAAARAARHEIELQARRAHAWCLRMEFEPAGRGLAGGAPPRARCSSAPLPPAAMRSAAGAST